MTSLGHVEKLAGEYEGVKIWAVVTGRGIMFKAYIKTKVFGKKKLVMKARYKDVENAIDKQASWI